MVPIPTIANDDERFVALVQRITSATIRDVRPRDVFVTRIDHWFDHRWLAFSGKTLGALPRYNRKLTVPPFIPDRVVSHCAYSLDATRGSYSVATPLPLHRYQCSSANLTRFISRVTRSGAFIWFSGDTQRLKQGSIMVYTSKGDLQGDWYASLRRTDDWRPYKVKGISKAQFDSLVQDEVGLGERALS